MFFCLKRHVFIYKVKFSAIRYGVDNLWVVNQVPYKIECHANIPFCMLLFCHFLPLCRQYLQQSVKLVKRIVFYLYLSFFGFIVVV